MSDTRPANSEPPDAVPAPPVTGHPAIDKALAAFEPGEDVHGHHDAIAALLEVVQQALNPTQHPPVPRP